ncbi:hypothetical protein LWI29_004366 [Acer saccharum]|uniref:Ubiquitin-like protease family profile domain-containing protein n=1 Tax=Acer saccharum TaxID=4024 RepID=A0AA39W274_ACESA|nr:hypothetical protein LWI29_004366 [Acer saccharum]
MPAGTTDKPSEEWPVLSYKWTAEQIAWARGKNVGGCRPWNEVDTLLIPVNVGGGHWLMAKVGLTLRSIRLYDPVGQPDEYQVRNQQLACLRWFLPSMLNQICFYKKKRKGTNMNPDPFHMELIPPHNFSQQQTGLKHLRIESTERREEEDSSVVVGKLEVVVGGEGGVHEADQQQRQAISVVEYVDSYV